VGEISTMEGGLVSRARSGDEGAFQELYQMHRRPVFQFAWRMTGSQPAAEDVAQECFLSLLEGTGFDARRGGLRTYLLGMARHLSLKRVRMSLREAEEAEDAAGPLDPLGDLLTAERSAIVGRAISELPVLQREALILFEYEELPMEEIARVTGSDVGAIKGRLFRARETLRRRLGPLMAAQAARSTS
jgi:RNA polymerase sigma-70 factor (ECF subfamily)